MFFNEPWKTLKKQNMKKLGKVLITGCINPFKLTLDTRITYIKVILMTAI